MSILKIKYKIKIERQKKNELRRLLQIAHCCFLECASQFQKAQRAIIALQSNYFSADRAKLCGTPVENVISKLPEKRQHLGPLRTPEWLRWTDILGFLTS